MTAVPIAIGEIRLTVSELFGPTVQGEGPSAGRRCAFIRLGHCNLDCAWCDTPYTWDWTGKNGVPYDRGHELHHMTTLEVLDDLITRGVDRVVVSGGEPMVQRVRLAHLFRILRAAVYTIEVETNGTLHPGACLDLVDQWNVSPKLAHSGVPRERAWRPDVLKALANHPGTAFKFVCQQPSDLDEVAEFCALLSVPASRVWIMPEGIYADDISNGLADLADHVIERGYNLTTRLHVLAWGNTRGT